MPHQTKPTAIQKELLAELKARRDSQRCSAMGIVARFWRKVIPTKWVERYPFIHHFPNVGPEGEITINCEVWATSWPQGNDPLTLKDKNATTPRITPHCMGAFLVEVHEHGLRFRWKPAEKLDKAFLVPYEPSLGPKPKPDPAQNRGDSNP